jgi:MinD superfamily P-loop ATPase
LGIGADNSGKLVAHVKNIAKEIAEEYERPYVLVDGSPGVGCPVVSSLSGAHFVVLVTEPTVSGLHDLKRVYELVNKFHIKAGCIINKSDLNLEKTNEIIEFLKQENIIHLANLPYNESFTKAMTDCKTIVEVDDNIIKETLEDIWKEIKQIIK